MKPYIQKPEMQWKMTDEVAAARRHPAWRDFMLACLRQKLIFDHIERTGRRDWECVAHTCKREELGWKFFFLAEGRGKTPIEALLDAYEKSGFTIPEAAAPAALLRGEAPTPSADNMDMDDLLG